MLVSLIKKCTGGVLYFLFDWSMYIKPAQLNQGAGNINGLVTLNIAIVSKEEIPQTKMKYHRHFY